MKKIAVVVPSLFEGGGVPSVAKFVVDTAISSGRYMPKIISLSMFSGDVESKKIFVPSTWSRGVIVRDSIWNGQPAFHVGANWAEFEFQRYKPRSQLNNLLSECDLIQVVCGSPAWANSVTNLGKPVALQVATLAKVERVSRDARAYGLLGYWRKAMTEVTDFYDKKALMSVDAIQVENPWMLDYSTAVNNGRCVDIRYAPPGVDSKIFYPASRTGYSKNPYILVVGRLNDPRKNIGMALEAYSKLPHELLCTVDLVLAGSASPPDAFWDHVANLGLENRVRFVDHPSLAELVALYQNAAVFLLTSHEEGLGVVILEAMACAIPVIATRCGGPEGIISDGVSGFLVNLDDLVGLTDRLIMLLTNYNLNVEMGNNGRSCFEARYEQSVAGSVFVDMWDLLLG